MKSSKGSGEAADPPSTPASLGPKWLSGAEIIAVGVGDPGKGTTFAPHLTGHYLGHRNGFVPVESPRESKPSIRDHMDGKLTGVPCLDLCCWLGGKAGAKVWLGSLEEAKKRNLVRAVFVQFRTLGSGIGFIPSGWQSPDLPDRIAVLGLTRCGRVEIHKLINDGRNRAVYDSVVQWSEIQSAS